MSSGKKPRKPRKRNVYAAALKLFKPKVVKAKKGIKTYNRKKLGKPELEDSL